MDNNQKIEAYFQEFMARIQNVQSKLPEIIGNEVINHALDNFKDESFNGQKWKKRKNKKDTRKLLIQTGDLRRSLRIISSSPTSVTVGSSLIYAAVHNNGGEINRAARSETFVRNRYKTGKKGKMFGGMGAFKKGTSQGQGQTYKAYGYNMPIRKFLGITPKLTASIKQIVNEEFEKEFGEL
jgi:phage gpG-like protein